MKRLSMPVKIHPAVIAVWAAVVAAAHIIPAIPMLGTGSTFSLATALSPLSGILFGPIAGALCSAAGGFIGSLVAPHTAWMGLGTFIIGTTTAFTAGCIAWGGWPLITLNARGSLIVNGGIIVYLIGTVLWFSQETGRSLLLFPLVYYGAGFAALIAGSIVAGRILTGTNKVLKLLVLWLCAFGGMIGGATIGNFFSLILYQLPRETWLYLTVAAPLERIIFSLATALIGAPLLAGLPKIGIFAGPQGE
ncbi:MAG: ECF transporter S component [Treponema sp.]|nr:ECF transporter S component [Treponema sp.]